MPRSGGVWDEVAAGEAELMVVGDARGEREQSYADSHPEVVQGPGSVAFESEGALGGVDDRGRFLMSPSNHASTWHQPSRGRSPAPGLAAVDAITPKPAEALSALSHTGHEWMAHSDIADHDQSEIMFPLDMWQ
jgi:hypothetical protein